MIRRPLHPIVAELRRRRLEANLLQSEVAERIFTTDASLSQWETGKVSPRLDDVTRWAGVLGGYRLVLLPPGQ